MPAESELQKTNEEPCELIRARYNFPAVARLERMKLEAERDVRRATALLSAEYPAHMFNRFEQLTDQRRSDFRSDLVEAHSNSVEVGSKPSAGATFTLRLPVHASSGEQESP
jgi:hypothetical protein